MSTSLDYLLKEKSFMLGQFQKRIDEQEIEAAASTRSFP